MTAFLRWLKIKMNGKSQQLCSGSALPTSQDSFGICSKSWQKPRISVAQKRFGLFQIPEHLCPALGNTLAAVQPFLPEAGVAASAFKFESLITVQIYLQSSNRNHTINARPQGPEGNDKQAYSRCVCTWCRIRGMSNCFAGPLPPEKGFCRAVARHKRKGRRAFLTSLWLQGVAIKLHRSARTIWPIGSETMAKSRQPLLHIQVPRKGGADAGNQLLLLILGNLDSIQGRRPAVLCSNA